MAEWMELLISTHARTLHNPALAIWTTAKLGPVLSVMPSQTQHLTDFPVSFATARQPQVMSTELDHHQLITLSTSLSF